MRSQLGDLARLHHIVEAIQEIESYTSGVTIDEFAHDSMMQHACVKQLEIIGEASNNITSAFRSLHSTIPWRESVELRNVLVHEYFGVKYEIVWTIIQRDIPRFKQQITELLNRLK
ncbi:MAG: DUF86 domain-containing protein [Bacteroidota bacterium]